MWRNRSNKTVLWTSMEWPCFDLPVCECLGADVHPAARLVVPPSGGSGVILIARFSYLKVWASTVLGFSPRRRELKPIFL